jgi:serine-type D-Ala-D-Ala carboxypeptidase (penicillin-binding protein 5/6)
MTGGEYRGRGRSPVCACAVAVALTILPAIAAPAATGQGGTPQQSATATAATEVPQPPSISARAWILIDPRDGTVLASKAPDRRLPIASTTKLMTAYLTLEELKPSQRLRAAPYRPSAAAEILLGLSPGERVRVRDLLYGLLLPSANDAAQTLAVGVGGSEAAFVDEMNNAAQRLGLTNTSYANPIGLDDPNNFSSARDLVTLAGRLLENPLFARIVDTPAAILRSTSEPRRVETRNTLLNSEPFVSGVKTGHTLGAGYVLVGSGTEGATTLVSAVLGAPSESVRDDDTLKLLDYGFSLYRHSLPVEEGEELASPELEYRDDHVSLVAKRSIPIEARQGQQVATSVDAPDEISGAVEEGETLGRVVVTVDGEAAASSPLIATESVAAASIPQKAVAIGQNPVLLLPLGAIVILVGLFLATRGRRPEENEEPLPRNDRRERRERERTPQERTPEERRRMHEERMRRRRRRTERKEGA